METAAAAAEEPRRKHGRRTFLVDRGFQLRYTLTIVAANFVISMIFGAMMYRAHQENSALLAVPPEFLPIVAEYDRSALYTMAGISAMMAGALGLLGVLFTHRVAGPLFVLGHYVSILAKGRYPVLRPLRKGDELREFFEGFQRAVEGLRDRDRKVAQRIDEAVARAEAGDLGALKALRELAREKREIADDLVGRPVMAPDGTLPKPD
jgi:hypothetical protein